MNNRIDYIKAILVIISGLLYCFNVEICDYFYPCKDCDRWWDLKFMFHFTIFAIMAQALCLTDDKILRFVSSIIVGWCISDWIILYYPHTQVEIHTRTQSDYIIMASTLLIGVINYHTTDWFYKTIKSSSIN